LLPPAPPFVRRLGSAICLALVAGYLASGPVLASDGSSASPEQACVPPGDIPIREAISLREDEPIIVESRHSLGGTTGPINFSGDVELSRGDQRLVTQELVYNPQTGRLDIPTALNYRDGVIAIDADNAWYSSHDEEGRFENVFYRIAGAEGSGHARSIHVYGGEYSQLEGFDFTTCDPESPDWQLKAGRVELDHEEGVGTARNARLDFKGVPILYSPWLSFPLDNRRKSGFLYPVMGFSSDDGLDLAIPWYWNIAPNQDATFTPRWISRRGGWLGSEYRYLGQRHRGQVNAEMLPNDRRTGDDRYYVRAEHRARLAPRWSSSVDFRRASDELYFTDLGSDLEESTIQYLRSSARVTGRGRHWNTEVLADAFQVLDDSVEPGQEPYRRLPRVGLQGDWPLGAGFDLTVDSEVVYFHRDAGITGARGDFLPRLTWTWLRPGGFVRPGLGFRSTAWELDGAEDNSQTRSLPIASLDSGLFFERTTGRGMTQTLEPRLFYLYVPRRDQSDLPRFDTSELTFGFSQLFHYNRFSGPDRQSDANQLTLAATTRLLNPDTGRSQLEFSAGQIFHFRDQAVQLGDEPPDDRNRSSIISELTWRPTQAISTHLGLQWDPEESETEVAAFGLNFRGRDSRQFALGYRFRRDRVDQADFRVRWPLTGQLNAIGRVNYSFMESEALELLGGLEYESCCWAATLTARQWIRDRLGDSRTAIFLELHLKGLGSLGRRPYEMFNEPR